MNNVNAEYIYSKPKCKYLSLCDFYFLITKGTWALNHSSVLIFKKRYELVKIIKKIKGVPLKLIHYGRVSEIMLAEATKEWGINILPTFHDLFYRARSFSKVGR